MITFSCECGKRHQVKDELAGKRGKCSCGKMLVIPQSAAIAQTDEQSAKGYPGLAQLPTKARFSARLPRWFLLTGIAAAALIIGAIGVWSFSMATQRAASSSKVAQSAVDDIRKSVDSNVPREPVVQSVPIVRTHEERKQVAEVVDEEGIAAAKDEVAPVLDAKPVVSSAGKNGWTIFGATGISTLILSNGVLWTDANPSPLWIQMRVDGTYPGLPSIDIERDFKFYSVEDGAEAPICRVTGPTDFPETKVGNPHAYVDLNVFLASVSNGICSRGYGADEILVEFHGNEKIRLTELLSGRRDILDGTSSAGVARQNANTSMDDRFSSRSFEERIASVLEMFGDADSFTGSEVANIAAAREQLDLLKNGLRDKDLAEAWVPLVKRIADTFPDATLTLQTTKEPSWREVQRILGREQATEVSRIRRNTLLAEEVTVVWYMYGWCHFAVADDRVIRLRADCKMIE